MHNEQLFPLVLRLSLRTGMGMMTGIECVLLVYDYPSTQGWDRGTLLVVVNRGRLSLRTGRGLKNGRHYDYRATVIPPHREGIMCMYIDCISAYGYPSAQRRNVSTEEKR